MSIHVFYPPHLAYIEPMVLLFDYIDSLAVKLIYVEPLAFASTISTL